MPPLVILAAAALLGAAAALPLERDQRLVVAAGIAILAGWLVFRKREARLIRALAIAALAFGTANAWIHVNGERVAPHSERTARYSGTVLGDVQSPDADATSFAFGLDGGPVVLAHARGAPPPIGAHVLIRGRLQPFDGPRNPYEPDERALERERGLEAQLLAGQVLGSLPAGPLDTRVILARMHAWAFDQLNARLPSPAAAIIAGELWGERSALPPELRAEFQETGTVHILVTAGLHLGVIVALALLLLRVLHAPRIAACASAAGCAWAYALFSGAHVPSLRAAMMVTFALTARAVGAKALSWNALAAAALFIVVFDPQAIATSSFALSFSCVGAIVACADPLARRLERFDLPARLRDAAALALATQAGTWPLTAAIFLQFSTYAVIANLAVVPAVGLTMLLAMAQFVFTWLPPVAQACANLDAWLIAWTVGCVELLAALPGSHLPMTPAPAWCVACYDAALIGGVALWRRAARTAAVCGLAIAVSLVVWPPRPPDLELRVTVLDVGQADAIVVETPGGHALLIDAGGRLERGPQTLGDSSAERVGERVVVPFLLRSGVHALDDIMLSHPHGDHAGGVAPVLRALRVGMFADSGQRYPGSAYRDALATARAGGVEIVQPRAGMTWRSDDGVSIQFLGPSEPFIAGSRNDINENSVAFILQYGKFRMLFTGDAGGAAEQRFLNESVDLGADVLKVGHHGSAYSSTPAFIAAVHPKYAIISVGRHNMFGHPAQQTLETLRNYGAQVYRTDENGAVTIRTDGQRTDIQAML